jgi:hypothetical protein
VPVLRRRDVCDRRGVARRSGWEDVLPRRRMLPSKQPLPHQDAPVASRTRR